MWLKAVEDTMRVTLQDILSRSMKSYVELGSINQLLGAYPAQCLIASVCCPKVAFVRLILIYPSTSLLSLRRST